MEQKSKQRRGPFHSNGRRGRREGDQAVREYWEGAGKERGRRRKGEEGRR